MLRQFAQAAGAMFPTYQFDELADVLKSAGISVEKDADGKAKASSNRLLAVCSPERLEHTVGLLEQAVEILRATQARRRQLIQPLVEKLRHVASLFAAWRAAVVDSRPHQLARRIIKESGLGAYYGRRQRRLNRRGLHEHAIRNLRVCVELCRRLDEDSLPPYAATQQLLTQIALMSKADWLPYLNDRVPVLTVHQAKGLDFDIVFVAALTLPESISLEMSSCRSDGSQGGGTSRLTSTSSINLEELRVFYVAATRARTRLYLCGSPPDAPGPRSQWDPTIDFAGLAAQGVLEVLK